MDERTTDLGKDNQEAPSPPIPRIGVDGKPVHDQEFFLALARRGKDTWNAWRASNAGLAATFAGIDFRTPDNASIAFSYFRFGDDPDFSGCIFNQTAGFSNAAHFDNASFGDRANFTGVRFNQDADFSRAVFGAHATFAGATFGDNADFAHSTFGTAADFSCAVFSYRTKFCDSKFEGVALFSGTTFGISIDFSRALFAGIARFDAVTLEDWKMSISNRIAAWPGKWHREFSDYIDLQLQAGVVRPKSINASFSNAMFDKEASFCGRRFDGPAIFTDAIFNHPPDFDGCEGVGRIDFYGAKIRFSGGKYIFGGWTKDGKVALRLRALRKLAEETSNHDLERDLYLTERRAERGILFARYLHGARGGDIRPLHFLRPRLLGHCLWIAVMAVYRSLADYGRSFLRPLIALAASVFLFHWAYSAVLIRPNIATKLEDFHRATWAFAISNAVPFVGALTLERDVKLTLLCGDRPIDAVQAAQLNRPVCVPVPGRRFQLLSLAQSIFSALCIFFAGLALRNYFKLR